MYPDTNHIPADSTFDKIDMASFNENSILYSNVVKKIVLIGVEFSKKKRNIVGFDVERMDGGFSGE
jgi:hypothetical protein